MIYKNQNNYIQKTERILLNILHYQYCSYWPIFQLQICLSMCDLLVDTIHERPNLKILYETGALDILLDYSILIGFVITYPNLVGENYF